MTLSCTTDQYESLSTHSALSTRFLSGLSAGRKLLGKVTITALESLFGLTAGAAAGWGGGWCVGQAYQNACNAGHLSTFEATRAWYYLPETFAGYGLLIGAGIGLVAVIFISRRMKRNRVLELHQKGITRPYDLAKLTGLSRRQVETILDRCLEDVD